MDRGDNHQYPDADVDTGRSLFDTNNRIVDLSRYWRCLWWQLSPGKTKSPPIPFSLKSGDPKIASSTSNTTGASTSEAQFFAQPKWIGAEPNEYLCEPRLPRRSGSSSTIFVTVCIQPARMLSRRSLSRASLTSTSASTAVHVDQARTHNRSVSTEKRQDQCWQARTIKVQPLLLY